MDKLDNIERTSSGVFIAYNYNMVIRYLKHPAFTETLISESLGLYNL